MKTILAMNLTSKIPIITKSHICKQTLLLIAAIIFIASLQVLSAQPSEEKFKLCSPSNGDRFDVAKPLLFWQSRADASRYEVYIDDAKVGEIPATRIPVISYAPETALKTGAHRWFVKAFDSKGATSISDRFQFTVTDSTNWPAWAIGPFVRYGKNPILTPQGTNWEAWNAYNPGVIFDGDRFRMLYRGEDKGDISRVGYAESLDGVTFTRRESPVIDATEKFEKKYGCEDARLFKYQGVYYTFYTGNQENGGIALCEAVSTNGTDWTKLGIIQAGTKNGALVCDHFGTPVKINGKFAMFTGNSRCGVCYSDDLKKWSSVTWIDLKLPTGWVKPWEPCVAVADYSKTQPDNIVVFIAGTLNGKGKWFYAISETLFSKNDLTKKVAQLDDCIMKPREAYESGTFTNCLWMNSIVLHNGQWWMHYGAGDRNVGLATAPLK
jgi:predicted GH43/DUF377 family glycosyl hydrolase